VNRSTEAGRKDNISSLDPFMLFSMKKILTASVNQNKWGRGSAIPSGMVYLEVFSLSLSSTHRIGQSDAFPFGAFERTTGANCRPWRTNGNGN
jgi:hypothetical protein